MDIVTVIKVLGTVLTVVATSIEATTYCKIQNKKREKEESDVS